jgi:D-alanyl-D-alanine carboxypeptidase
VLCSDFHVFAANPPKAAIVVNANNGDILYSSNIDKKTQPASLAKMMTLHLLFKELEKGRVSFNTKMRTSKLAAHQNPSVLELKEGESISCKDAILSQITKSANDVSIVIAEHLAGSVGNFVKMMNNEAKRLNMCSTVFFTPSGWKNTKQLTTARDMAKLASAILKEHPRYYGMFSTKKFKYKGKIHPNHNALLGEKNEIIIDGIKTGFVCASGFNIAVSAKKGKERLIVVVLGEKTAKKRNDKVEHLLNFGFAKVERNNLRLKNRYKLIQLINSLQKEAEQNKKKETKPKNKNAIDIAKDNKNVKEKAEKKDKMDDDNRIPEKNAADINAVPIKSVVKVDPKTTVHSKAEEILPMHSLSLNANNNTDTNRKNSSTKPKIPEHTLAK